MPIRPIPYITLHKEETNTGHESNGNNNNDEEGDAHYTFEVNEEAVKLLQDIEDPVSVSIWNKLIKMKF